MNTVRLSSFLIIMSAFSLVSALYIYAQESHNYYGITDLIRAIRSNDTQRVDMILRNSDTGMVNYAVNSGVTPLHIASALNYSNIIRLLVELGAKVDAWTSAGFTPLHWAAGKDAVDSVKQLIELGADVNAVTTNGITPLHWAATKNATNAIKYLITSGADLSKTTANGFTPIHWAVMKEANEAGIMLAYTTVSREMDKDEPGPVIEKIEGPDIARQTQHSPNNKEPAYNVTLPRPAYSKTLTVPLGMGEEVLFLWIEDLRIWIGKYEITNGQYRRFKPKHNSLFYEGYTLNDNDQPAVYVSWNDAKEFCAWLNNNFIHNVPLNCTFRLPTEKEWFSAARCGNEREFPWGNKLPPLYGNFSDLTARKKLSDWSGIEHYEDGYPVTCPVTKSGENEKGIYGLAGNVWEWCEDWYDSSNKYKVRHGGSWYFDGGSDLRINRRGFDRPDAHYDTIGLRVVIAPKDI